MAYTPVSALLVGTVSVDFDNLKPHRKQTELRNFQQTVHLKKAEHFGKFMYGSTIVLVFEAPKNSKFSKQDQMPVRMGERLIDV